LKKVFLLSLFLYLFIPGLSFAAEELFRPNSFFQQIEVIPKSTPKKVTPKVEPVTPEAPPVQEPTTPSPEPSATQANLEREVLASNVFVSHEDPFWWVIALVYALAAIGFAFSIKRWPKIFKRWNKSIYYYVLLVTGLVFWMIHYYLHFMVYKYDLSFLCYNYWLVMGFEVMYFWMIFALIFGVRTKKIRREVRSS